MFSPRRVIDFSMVISVLPLAELNNNRRRAGEITGLTDRLPVCMVWEILSKQNPSTTSFIFRTGYGGHVNIPKCYRFIQ
jgi:hypothetical protein